MRRKTRWALGLLAAAGAGMLAVGLVVRAEPARQSPLPEAKTKGTTSLEEALARRRSVRRFQGEKLTTEQIGQLCWAAQGVTEPKSGLRTCPSAGALYPLELFVATAAGVERYVPARHAMAQHLKDDVRGGLQRAALGQEAVGGAPAVFAIAGVVSRTQQKYGQRAQRYVYMEAGHAAQNLLLQATAMGLGGVPIGAFDDAQVAKVLKLPGDHAPLYLVPIGRPVR